MDSALKVFQQDKQGRTYTDVFNDPRFKFGEVIAFLNTPARIQRMLIAQEHFKVPPLGGVAVEIEKHEMFSFLRDSPKEYGRLKQAIGVAVRIIMEQHNWTKKGEKGSMCAISKIFRKAELYNPPK